MSGMIMLRGPGGIVVASDGGYYRSNEDYTLTGWLSKPNTYPQISAVTTMVGYSTLDALVRLNCEGEWTSFDVMVERFRENVLDQLHNAWRIDPYRDGIICLFYLGGYSDARERWETYSIGVNTFLDEFEDGVGEMLPGHAAMTMPALDPPSLEKYGIDGQKIDIDWQNPDPTLIAMMRSMRAAGGHEGAYGDESDPARWASFIGAHIEVVNVMRDAIFQKIVWRWPDEVGQRIDIANEGEPTYWGRPADEQT